MEGVVKSAWQIQHDEKVAEAKIKYDQIIKESEGKTYLELLPKDIKLNSWFGKLILDAIELSYAYLNKCSLYDGKQFTKETIVHFMKINRAYSGFILSDMFIKKKDSLELTFKVYDAHPELVNMEDKEKAKEIRANYREDNIAQYEEYYECGSILEMIRGRYANYEQRQAVKNRTADMELEPNGYPRNGRGNLCYAFYPVKGDYDKLEVGGKYTIHKNKSKRDVLLTVLEQNPDDDTMFKCDLNGKEIFIQPHAEIAEAWDCLHRINKYIWTGWWNRTLILN